MDSLPPRRALFVREYLKDVNAARAARAAGYSAHSSARFGHRLLQEPEIAAAVEAAMKARLEALKIEGEDVLRMLIETATADPNELVQVRRVNCRHCHGKDFRYQRTAREMARDRAQHCADMARQQRDADKAEQEFTPTAFDEQGGDGFERVREPHDGCPECCGEGEPDVHVTDSRLLQGPARRLFAGVKVTKEGIEVKMRDQDKAVELLGRHLGMFLDRVEHSGTVDLANAVIAGRRRSKASEPDPPGSDLV